MIIAVILDGQQPWRFFALRSKERLRNLHHTPCNMERTSSPPFFVPGHF